MIAVCAFSKKLTEELVGMAGGHDAIEVQVRWRSSFQTQTTTCLCRVRDSSERMLATLMHCHVM